MNKSVFILLLVLCNISCKAQSEKSLSTQQFVDEFVADSCFHAAGVGIVVSDLKTGELLASNQAHLGLTPASTQKLITSAAALEILGAAYQFKTQIKIDGEILQDGILNGNVIVKGFGDPSLGSKYFANGKSIEVQIAEKLQQSNIKKISGKIITDATYIKAKIPSTWIWEDIGNYYGAVPNGLTYKDNTYTIFFSSRQAGSKTKITKTEPQNTGLIFDNQVLSSSINRDLAYIFGGNTSNKRRIEGSIPKNRSVFKVKGALLNPENSLIEALTKSITALGIRIENENLLPKKSKLLFTLYSPKLNDIVKITNQKSVNLFADHLLFEIGQNQSDEASWESGISAVKNFWESKGLNTKYISLYDGSGLSHFNTVSADFFDQVLKHMNQSKYRSDFIASLPVAGQSGTLKNFGRNSAINGNWIAKTGSMTGVRTYCGYLTTKNGKRYSVSILINNYSSSTSALNNKLLNLLIKLYNS